MRFDINKMNKGQQILQLQNPSQSNGSSYGVLELGFEGNSTDSFEFIVFGGYDEDGNDMQQTCVFRTSLTNFQNSEWSDLTSPVTAEKVLLDEGDYFDDNMMFPLPETILTAQFLEVNVTDKQKKQYLLNLKNPRSQLVGVVGLNAFHVFDKTTRMWVASVTDLGLENI